MELRAEPVEREGGGSRMGSGSSMARFGVVTPVLNGEEFLRQTLDSIWTQVSDDVEIDHVLVDGGSTDATLEIAADYPHGCWDPRTIKACTTP